VFGENWGGTESEVARRYPADAAGDAEFGAARLALTRAVGVRAPARLVYRWLCQIKLAPYSYDLLDNLGRRSPQELVEGTDAIAVGDRMMVFQVTDVEPGHQWTGRMTPSAARMLGRGFVTYAAEPDGTETRLVVRYVAETRGLLGATLGRLLALGDLVMMRRQLLNLRRLAERDAVRALQG
jgi:hypothetical protein